MHRRLLFVYRTRRSVSLLTHFHSETLPAGQICQSKGVRPYKYHPCGVWTTTSVACFSLGIHIWNTSKQASVWNTAAMGPLNLFTAMVLSMSCHFQPASAWYVAYFWRNSFKIYCSVICVCWWPWLNVLFLFYFYRTVNNFLMTGPKVNIVFNLCT